MIVTEEQLKQRRANSAAIAKRKRASTHCIRGHEFTKQNTYWRADGRRQCLACATDRSWYAARGLKFT